MLDDQEKAAVSARWGQSRPKTEPTSLYSFGPVRDYMLQCISGDPQARADADWLVRWAIKEILGDRIPVDECLSVCCGSGAKERRLFRLGVFKRCTAMDISEKAIARARTAAKEEGIESIDYVVADVETADLGANKYDLVYASGALHHISRLEHTIAQMHRSLKPGGVLLSDEYVGPSFNDLSERHREIINAAIHLLPNRLRHASEGNFVPRRWLFPAWKRALFELGRLATLKPSTIDFGTKEAPETWPRYKKVALNLLKGASALLSRRGRKASGFRFGQVWDISPDAIRSGDPSEGVRAADIIKVVQSVFVNSTTVRYHNCGILHYALDPTFFAQFDPGRDGPILGLLMEIERTMTRLNEIPPVLAVIAATKA